MELRTRPPLSFGNYERWKALAWREVLRQLAPVWQQEKRRQLSTALSETLRASIEYSKEKAYPHLKLSGVVPLPVYGAERLAAKINIVVGAVEIGTADAKPGRVGKVEELSSQLQLHFFPK